MKNRSLYLLLGAFLITVLMTILVIKMRPMTPTIKEIDNNQMHAVLINVNKLILANKTKQAERILRSELEKNPSNQLMLSVLAKLYFHDQRYDKSEEIFRKLINLNREDATLYNNLGLVYAKSGDFAHALINYQASLELNPKSALTHLNISRLYELQKDKMQAQYHFNIARELLEKKTDDAEPKEQVTDEQN